MHDCVGQEAGKHPPNVFLFISIQIPTIKLNCKRSKRTLRNTYKVLRNLVILEGIIRLMLQIVTPGNGMAVVGAWNVCMALRVGLLMYRSQNSCTMNTDPTTPRSMMANQNILYRTATILILSVGKHIIKFSTRLMQQYNKSNRWTLTCAPNRIGYLEKRMMTSMGFALSYYCKKISTATL